MKHTRVINAAVRGDVGRSLLRDVCNSPFGEHTSGDGCIGVEVIGHSWGEVKHGHGSRIAGRRESATVNLELVLSAGVSRRGDEGVISAGCAADWRAILQ